VVIRELELIAQGNIDGDIFTKAGEALQKSWEESIQNNSYITRNYAYLTVVLDLPLGELEKMPELYRAVKPADIQKICADLLPKGPARIILYPEAFTGSE
jgi:predicted Zn-dependent peptidase